MVSKRLESQENLMSPKNTQVFSYKTINPIAETSQQTNFFENKICPKYKENKMHASSV
jgi:hypothetical protein